jgi:choline dehydrogenase-like flavoprotein
MAFDVIVVGSGAGGGTLAARLAEGGLSVCLVEAGGDAREAGGERMPDDHDVPAFHAFASEHPAMRWDFQVRHYADAARQARDPKSEEGQVLYPRAATLGGCTAHNAMIFAAPHDSDWNAIAALTGDRSWRARAMRRHFKRVENCQHRPLWRWLAGLGIDPTRHGWSGWLHTEHARPLDALRDRALVKLIADTAEAVTLGVPRPLASLWRALRGRGDPNGRIRGDFEGACYLPLSTRGHRRNGSRERVLAVAAQHPDRLHIELDALATRVLFDDEGRAVGVEVLKGRHLYRAHAEPSRETGSRCELRARREVVLCGGAFNTPQLMMLSGIGPRAELARHGIPLRVDLPGVGRNLQDRYEVALNYRMARPWAALAEARFERGDPLWQAWHDARCGMYTSNGAAVAWMRRSHAKAPAPDVFAMALPVRFEGYFPGYSALMPAHHDVLSWALLKAHTHNRAGVVRLRSADPRDTPEVDFHYFEEGSDTEGRDLAVLVDAVRTVRRMMVPLQQAGWIAEELAPGPSVQSDEAIAGWIRDTAWGHHASCSCAIGPADKGGVLDSRFQVHGVHGLRVVDASVFPRIPGFFIASAIYTVAEKAAELILNGPPKPI